MAVRQLEAMRLGGIFDHLGYGFSRYSLDRQWHIPHFEKMLGDNALSVLLYHEAGLATSRPALGRVSKEVLEYLRPWVDLYKVDLKSMREERYRELGGRLDVVLDTIRRLKEMGFWVEVVTLVVPGFNDSDEELRETARFLVSVSPDIPWHVTAFHGGYRMTDPDDTPPESLLRAAVIGREEGLHFVYAGNLPGFVGGWENTCCPGCKALLVERRGYRILRNRLRSGACPDCGRGIPGVWEAPASR